MVSLPGDWGENFTVQSAGDHAAIGAGVVIVTALFAHSWAPFEWVEPLLVLFVLLKEYAWDLREETGETVKSSTVDALGYLAGNVIGWGLLLLAWHLGTWSVR